MGCLLSKNPREDIYKIVKDTAKDMRSDTSSQIDKTMSATPSPKNKSEDTNSSSESPKSLGRGSRFGSSIFNFRTRRNKVDSDTEYVSVDPLYVIVPYFNYCGFKRRRELFLEFYNRIKDNPRIRIVVCEATERNHRFELPDNLPNVFQHIHIYTKDQLWIKENLINIAVRNLPTHWKYIAWLDSDIQFVEDDWVEKVIKRFEKYQVVQMFSTIVYLGPNKQALKTDKSFGYMSRKSGKLYTQLAGIRFRLITHFQSPSVS